MPLAPIWVVVADAASARVYAASRRGRPLALVREFSHPASTEPGRELVSDRPGRTRGGFGGRYYEPPTDPHWEEARKFALELADFLEGARARDEFRELALFAAPKFLGELRRRLSAQTRKRVIHESAEDLLHLEPRELAERLRECEVIPIKRPLGRGLSAPRE